MIRGLPVASTDDFAAVRDEPLDQCLPYRERSTPRNDLGRGVYSATEMPAPYQIRLHYESSYVLRFPGVLLVDNMLSCHGRNSIAATAGPCYPC